MKFPRFPEKGASLPPAAREAPRYPQFRLLSPSQVTQDDSPELRQEQGETVPSSQPNGGIKEYHRVNGEHMTSVPLSLLRVKP